MILTTNIQQQQKIFLKKEHNSYSNTHVQSLKLNWDIISNNPDI